METSAKTLKCFHKPSLRWHFVVKAWFLLHWGRSVCVDHLEMTKDHTRWHHKRVNIPTVIHIAVAILPTRNSKNRCQEWKKPNCSSVQESCQHLWSSTSCFHICRYKHKFPSFVSLFFYHSEFPEYELTIRCGHICSYCTLLAGSHFLHFLMGKSAKPIVVWVVWRWECNICIGNYMQKDVYYLVNDIRDDIRDSASLHDLFKTN